MQITKYIRLDKKDKKGLVPVFFSITKNGWQHRMATGEKVLPENFDSKTLRVKSKQAGYISINLRLDDLYKKIFDIGISYGKELTRQQFEKLAKQAMQLAAPELVTAPTLSFTELSIFPHYFYRSLAR
jgi:hypothetical protein